MRLTSFAALALAVSAPAFSQYTVDTSTKTIKIVANFEGSPARYSPSDVDTQTGLDEAWNFTTRRYSPHYWLWASPWYSYPTPAIPPSTAWWGTTNAAWENPYQPDNVNWWHTLGATNGQSGYSDNLYRLFIPTDRQGQPFNNYQNWTGYDKLLVKWNGYNPKSSAVNLGLFLRTYESGATPYHGVMNQTTRVSGVTNTEVLTLPALSDEAKTKVGDLLFRVHNNTIAPGSDYLNNFQRTHLYSIKLQGSFPPSSPEAVAIPGATRKATSRFLGSVMHSRHGSYSATGYFDTADSKFKLWYGGGIPEYGSSDNVYYVETPSLNVGTDVGTSSKPVRVNMNYNGVRLCPRNGPMGYGGDPSVIRLQGETLKTSAGTGPYNGYVMFFTGVAERPDRPGCTASTYLDMPWNQVYRAISTNGIDWKVDPPTPIVSQPNLIAQYRTRNGGEFQYYGAGAPSVTYLNGKFHLYYYAQGENYPDGGVYYRTSSDGYTFGNYTRTTWYRNGARCKDQAQVSAIDAKYVDSLGWVAVLSQENTLPPNAPQEPCIGSRMGVYMAYSNDGLNWYKSNNPIAADPGVYLNHNPGLIGDRLGRGFKDMYVTYGASEKEISDTEMYTRQLEYSSVKIE